MTARILQGSVFDVLPTLEPGSVDVAVTSPPYWMLRSYLPKGHALKALELGSEPTPEAYIDNMVRVFALVKRALAEHACCFLNIGDTYAGGSGGDATKSAKQKSNNGTMFAPQGQRMPIDAGNLCLVPQRLALALQADDWIVRSVIVWHKPAPMPASVSGWRWMRCRVKVKGQKLKTDSSTHTLAAGMSNGRPHGVNPDWLAQWSDCPGCPKCEPHGGYVLRRGSWRPTSAWEPILLLAKSPNYFCDGESVKQPPALATVNRDKYTRVLDDPDEQFAVRHDHETLCTGANPRDVQTWAAEPLSEAHYAAFPTALVDFCLRAGTSQRGYCPACGAPWARVLETTPGENEASERPKKTAGMDGASSTLSLSGNGSKEWAERGPQSKTLGWKQTCSCPEQPPRPALVLDPFCGSGRTGIQAKRLSLDFVGCELNEAYVDMATRLLGEEMPLFA